MPVGFCNVDASGAFVTFGAFDLIHVSASREMVMRKFDDADLGTVLQSGKGLHGYLPIDGSKSIDSPGVPGHEFLAYSWAVCCLS
jgi:hypothetical protein